MNRYIIDAGVAVKWFLTETHSDKARTLLAQFQQHTVELTARELLIAKVANVFWKRAARHDITAQEAADNLNDLLAINLPLVSAPLLAPRALALASAYQRSAYDCFYLALALERGDELITTDERLVNAVGAQFPQLILLRDLQI